MPVSRPEEMSRAFAEAVEAADVERLLALYDPSIQYVSRRGEVAHGLDGVRRAFRWLEGFVGKVETENQYCIVCGDTALVRAVWRIRGTGAGGRVIDSEGLSAEVLRRGADGVWRYIVDHPFGGNP
jgi:ketosteroid isomerase-like protein